MAAVGGHHDVIKTARQRIVPIINKGNFRVIPIHLTIRVFKHFSVSYCVDFHGYGIARVDRGTNSYLGCTIRRVGVYHRNA